MCRCTCRSKGVTGFLPPFSPSLSRYLSAGVWCTGETPVSAQRGCSPALTFFRSLVPAKKRRRRSRRESSRLRFSCVAVATHHIACSSEREEREKRRSESDGKPNSSGKATTRLKERERKERERRSLPLDSLTREASLFFGVIFLSLFLLFFQSHSTLLCFISDHRCSIASRAAKASNRKREEGKKIRQQERKG